LATNIFKIIKSIPWYFPALSNETRTVILIKIPLLFFTVERYAAYAFFTICFFSVLQCVSSILFFYILFCEKTLNTNLFRVHVEENEREGERFNAYFLTTVNNAQTHFISFNSVQYTILQLCVKTFISTNQKGYEVLVEASFSVFFLQVSWLINFIMYSNCSALKSLILLYWFFKIFPGTSCHLVFKLLLKKRSFQLFIQVG
jgi:hypothetical protein